jgi:hypothetical protein
MVLDTHVPMAEHSPSHGGGSLSVIRRQARRLARRVMAAQLRLSGDRGDLNVQSVLIMTAVTVTAVATGSFIIAAMNRGMATVIFDFTGL